MVSRSENGPCCRLIYEPNEGGGETLIRCVPNAGMRLYEVQYRHMKNRPYVRYYLLGATNREAKAKFRRMMPWIHDLIVREVTDAAAREEILTDRYRMPLNV